MRTNMWKPSFAAVPESAAKVFAVALEERLRDGMCRLRLGGNDIMMAWPKAWWGFLKTLPSVPSEEERQQIKDVIAGLYLLEMHHPYGTHLPIDIAELEGFVLSRIERFNQDIFVLVAS